MAAELYTVEWSSGCLADSVDEVLDWARESMRTEDPEVAISNEHGMTVWRSLYGTHDADMLTRKSVWVPSSEMMADLAEWMVVNNWDTSEIIEMIRKPHKYAPEYSAMIVEEEYDKVAKEPAELEEIEKETISSLTVTFTPQRWVDDEAVEVEVDWDQFDWNVSEKTAASIAEQIAVRRNPDLDFVRDDPFTPKWIKDWAGPFYIEPSTQGHDFDEGSVTDVCRHCGCEDWLHGTDV